MCCDVDGLNYKQITDCDLMDYVLELMNDDYELINNDINLTNYVIWLIYYDPDLKCEKS